MSETLQPGVAHADGGRSRSVVLHIASNDLFREFLLSLCLVLSVIAVLTPILLLASVKVGFIDRLRQDFIEDPSFREIRPGTADLRNESLFEEIRKWPGVDYAIPTVMMNPREVAVRVSGEDRPFRSEVRLLPSTADDPLLGRMTGLPPEGDFVVITADFAESADLDIGDEFTIVVTRIENDERRRVQFDVVVNGMIPADVLPSSTILSAPQLERHVENFRAGVSVPERGWTGVEMDSGRSYPFVVAVAPDRLGETLKSTLAIRIGASDVQSMDVVSLANLIGIELPLELVTPAAEIVVLTPGGSAYSGRDLIEANAVLRNSEAYAFGLHPALNMQLLGQTVRVFGLPEALRLTAGSGDVDKARSRGGSFRLNDRIVLPESLREAYSTAQRPESVTMKVEFEDSDPTDSLELSMRPSGFIGGDVALVSGELMAIIDRGRQVSLRFDSTSGKIFEQSAGFRGFRVVGISIDVIPALVERFEAAGMKVRAKSSQILKLQRLERSLNILVLVVSLVALAGGFSILTSSFFANVQRKKVAYATMRLIGMPRRLIFRIPIAQAIIIASLGFASSVACYILISFILNQFIAAELNFDGQLSKLYLGHFVSVGVFVVVGACLASLAASRAATSIDPAEALRAD